MAQGFSFKTSTTLMAAGYAVIAAVMVAGLGGETLTRSVGDIAPQVSWLMNETSAVRIGALRAAGHPELAALYGLVAAISWSMIAALCAGGFAWGLLNKNETALGVDKALNYLTAIACLYALSTMTEVLLHLTAVGAPQGGLHAIPALWFGTMIPSAAILARVGGLIAHDFGTLLGVAIDGDRERLSMLVIDAEERRGPKSLEARLARRLMAMRAAG